MTELKHSVFGSNMNKIQKEPELKMTVNDLHSLIELGCIHDYVKIGDKNFCLRSLNALERIELAKNFKDSDDDEKLFIFNVRLLSFAIETVNGIPFEDFHSDKNLDSLQRKQELLFMMQTPVLTKLLETYNNITERCEAQFKNEEIKK